MTAEFSVKPPVPTSAILSEVEPCPKSINKLHEEIARLQEEIAVLRQEKCDLEVLLETTVEHADMVEALLHESNRQLRGELLERKQVEKKLKRSKRELSRLFQQVSRDKQDLEIIVETITEHGDFIEEQTHQESIQDILTGLYNRHYLEDTLEREIQRAEQDKTSLGVVMIDIDYFKEFNDTFGHDAGDKVLQSVGECLRSQVGDMGIACRYGGEELTLVLPNSNMEGTYQVAEKTRQAVKKLLITHRGQLLAPVTISLGVACYPDRAKTETELLKAADVALYQAKNDGRDRVAIAI